MRYNIKKAKEIFGDLGFDTNCCVKGKDVVYLLFFKDNEIYVENWKTRHNNKNEISFETFTTDTTADKQIGKLENGKFVIMQAIEKIDDGYFFSAYELSAESLRLFLLEAEKAKMQFPDYIEITLTKEQVAPYQDEWAAHRGCTPCNFN